MASAVMSHSTSDGLSRTLTRKPTRPVPTPSASDPPLAYDPTTKKHPPMPSEEHTGMSIDSLYSTASGPPVYVHTVLPPDNHSGVSPAHSLRHSALAEEDEVFAPKRPPFMHTSPSWSSKAPTRGYGGGGGGIPRPPPPKPKPKPKGASGLASASGSASSSLSSTSRFLLRRDTPTEETSESRFSVAGKNVPATNISQMDVTKKFKIKAFNSSTLTKATSTDFCPSCGEINRELNFCQFCGTKMTTQTNQTENSEKSFREEGDDDNDLKARQHDAPGSLLHRFSNSFPKRSPPSSSSLSASNGGMSSASSTRRLSGPVTGGVGGSDGGGGGAGSASTTLKPTGGVVPYTPKSVSSSVSSGSSMRSSEDDEIQVSYTLNPRPPKAYGSDDDASDSGDDAAGGRPQGEPTMMDTIKLRAMEHVQSVNQNAQTGLGKIHTMSSTIKRNAMMNLVSNARTRIWSTVGKKSVPTFDAALTEISNPTIPTALPSPSFEVGTRPSPKPAPVEKPKDGRVSFDLSATSSASGISSGSGGPHAPPAAPKPKGVPHGAQPMFHVMRPGGAGSSPSPSPPPKRTFAGAQSIFPRPGGSSSSPSPPPATKAPFAGAQSVFPSPNSNTPPAKSSTPPPNASPWTMERGRGRSAPGDHKPTGLKPPPPRKRGKSLPGRKRSLRRPKVPLPVKKPTAPKPATLRGTRKKPQPPKGPRPTRPASKSAPGAQPILHDAMPKRDSLSSSMSRFSTSASSDKPVPKPPVSRFSTSASSNKPVPKPPPARKPKLTAVSAQSDDEPSASGSKSPRTGSLGTIMNRFTNPFKASQKPGTGRKSSITGSSATLKSVFAKASGGGAMASGHRDAGDISPSYASGSKTLGRSRSQGALARAMEYESRLRSSSSTSVDDGRVGKVDLEHLVVDRPVTVRRNRPALKKFVPSETINNIKM